MEIKIVALNIHHASYQQTQCILLKGESPVEFATAVCALTNYDRVVARKMENIEIRLNILYLS